MRDAIDLGGDDADRMDELEDLEIAAGSDPVHSGTNSRNQVGVGSTRGRNVEDLTDEGNIVQTSNVGDDSENVVKKRKKSSVPRFSVDMVCNKEKGLPKLSRDLKGFRTRGEGYEVEDLRKLLECYRQWLHDLYPRESFAQLILRLQKLPKDGIRDSLRQMRDEVVRKNLGLPEDTGVEENDSHTIVLDEDLQRRIEENRRKALEKRKQVKVSNAPVPAQTSNGSTQETIKIGPSAEELAILELEQAQYEMMAEEAQMVGEDEEEIAWQMHQD